MAQPKILSCMWYNQTVSGVKLFLYNRSNSEVVPLPVSQKSSDNSTVTSRHNECSHSCCMHTNDTVFKNDFYSLPVCNACELNNNFDHDLYITCS
jgi:hypothetical protein